MSMISLYQNVCMGGLRGENMTTNLALPVVGFDELVGDVNPQPLAVRVEPSQQQPL